MSLSEYFKKQYNKLHDRFAKYENPDGFVSKHRSGLKKAFIIVGTIAILFSLVEIPREIYRAVRNRQYYDNLESKDYWPVHDYYGNNVNIFEFEHYLESRGAEKIIKGYYYKEDSNTAICYDFNVDDTRFLLDNEIAECGYGQLKVISNLRIYDGDKIYGTDFTSGNGYVMDYRSPMWVDEKIFELLHDIMDDIEDGTYDHSECPFKGTGIAHYDEREGYYYWHDDVYDQ